jgi:hypothetical protein
MNLDPSFVKNYSTRLRQARSEETVESLFTDFTDSNETCTGKEPTAFMDRANAFMDHFDKAAGVDRLCRLLMESLSVDIILEYAAVVCFMCDVLTVDFEQCEECDEFYCAGSYLDCAANHCDT